VFPTPSLVSYCYKQIRPWFFHGRIFCADATKTATEVCKYTQLEFLDLFTGFCYTVNEDMKGGASDGQGGSN
jgi:hypothetical protein